MEIRQVQYFLAIAEKGSFSAASEELYISQSALSKQIMALEKELGFALFDRNKRKISMTAAGEAFLKYGRRLNQVYLDMTRELTRFKTTSPLSIAAIPVVAEYGITSCLARFRSAHPQIHFAMEEREAFTIPPALQSHQFELAFLRENYLPKSLQPVLEICRDKMVVTLSQKHRLAGRKSLRLEELSDQNFILFEKGTVIHEISMDAFRRAGFKPKIAYTGLRAQSVLSSVASQDGIALMMERVLDYHSHPGIVSIPLQEPIESRILLVASKNKELSKPARIFIEFLTADLRRGNAKARG